jgi:hypothetical protein
MKREVDHLARCCTWPSTTRRRSASPAPSTSNRSQGAHHAPIRLRRRRLPELPPRIRPLEHFKLNIETNHATLAGHTMQHELEVAGAAGALGSIDANTGDELLGWDTDQFPTEHLPHHAVMLASSRRRLHHRRRELRRQGPPRELEPVDLFHAHIGGMFHRATSAAWTPSPAASRSPRARHPQGRKTDQLPVRIRVL